MPGAEQITLYAGTSSRAADSSGTAVSRIVESEWPTPEPKRVMADGVDGSSPVDEASYENRTITITLRTTSNSGEAGARAWLQGWQRIAAVASRETTATLTSTFTSGTTLTFDVVTASVQSKLGQEHYMGFGELTLTVVCRPGGRKPQITLPGTLATVNGLSVWTGTDVIAGDLPALASITGTWAETRAQAATVVAGGTPTVVAGSSMTPRLTGWTSAAGADGAQSTNVLRGSVAYGSAEIVAETVPGLIGDYDIAVRVRAWAAGTGVADEYAPRFTVTVNGEAAATQSVAALTTPAGTAGETAGRGWRQLRFGRFTLSPADVVGIQIDAGSTGSVLGRTAAIDFIAFRPKVKAAAVVASRVPEPLSVVAGDTIPPDGSVTGALNGRTGANGGTWTASNVDIAGDSATSTGSSASATIGSSTLPCAMFVRFKYTGAGTVTFDLRDPAASSTPKLEVNPYDGTVKASSNVAGESRTLRFTQSPMPEGAYYDALLRIDALGRWSLAWAPTGRRLRTVASGHAPLLTLSTTFKPYVVVAGPDSEVSIKTLRLLRMSTTAGTTLQWSASTSALVRGALPTFAAAQTPVVIVTAAETDVDAAAAPNPTAVVVKVTPRYLQVPED